jgi:probable phosphoglycerate mutase
VSAAVEEIIAANPGRRVVAVAHGGAINVALAEVLGLERDLWVEVAYASISRVAASRQGARSIVSVNETGHLRGLL